MGGCLKVNRIPEYTDTYTRDQGTKPQREAVDKVEDSLPKEGL